MGEDGERVLWSKEGHFWVVSAEWGRIGRGGVGEKASSAIS